MWVLDAIEILKLKGLFCHIFDKYSYGVFSLIFINLAFGIIQNVILF